MFSGWPAEINSQHFLLTYASVPAVVVTVPTAMQNSQLLYTTLIAVSEVRLDSAVVRVLDSLSRGFAFNSCPHTVCDYKNVGA